TSCKDAYCLSPFGKSLYPDIHARERPHQPAFNQVSSKISRIGMSPSYLLEQVSQRRQSEPPVGIYLKGTDFKLLTELEIFGKTHAAAFLGNLGGIKNTFFLKLDNNKMPMPHMATNAKDTLRSNNSATNPIKGGP